MLKYIKNFSSHPYPYGMHVTAVIKSRKVKSKRYFAIMVIYRCNITKLKNIIPSVMQYASERILFIWRYSRSRWGSVYVPQRLTRSDTESFVNGSSALHKDARRIFIPIPIKKRSATTTNTYGVKNHPFFIIDHFILLIFFCHLLPEIVLFRAVYYNALFILFSHKNSFFHLLLSTI